MKTTWGALMVRWVVRLALVAIVFLLFLGLIPIAWVQLLYLLPLGWVGFLQRVLPQVSLNASAIGLGAICSVLIIVGIHWLASGFRAHAIRLGGRSDSGPSSAPLWRWRWSWSIAVYAVVWLLFLAAMGSAGLVHQLAWMVRSKEPIYVVREWSGRWISSLRYQSAVLAMAAEEAHWDVAATRAAFFGEQSDIDSGNRVRTPYGPRSGSRNDALEDLQVVLVPDSAGQMVAGLLFYRDDARREKSGFVVVRRGAVSEPQPALELPATLARLAQESLDQTGTAR